MISKSSLKLGNAIGQVETKEGYHLIWEREMRLGISVHSSSDNLAAFL